MVQITRSSKYVRRIILGGFGVLAFLGAIIPTIRGAVFINLMFLGIAWLVYGGPEYQDNVSSYKSKGAIISIFYGFLATIFFYTATKFIPGLSLAFPSVPNAIADSLRFFLVVVVAPPAEEMFFRGALLGYFGELFPRARHLDVWFQAIAFSLFHLGAYIIGFYQLPDIASGLSAFYANLSVFIVAFTFGMISGYVLKYGKNTKKNLWFSTTFHWGLNAIAYSLAIAVIV